MGTFDLCSHDSLCFLIKHGLRRFARLPKKLFILSRYLNQADTSLEIHPRHLNHHFDSAAQEFWDQLIRRYGQDTGSEMVLGNWRPFGAEENPHMLADLLNEGIVTAVHDPTEGLEGFIGEDPLEYPFPDLSDGSSDDSDLMAPGAVDSVSCTFIGPSTGKVRSFTPEALQAILPHPQAQAQIPSMSPS